MTVRDTDLVQAIRLNELLIDPDTGEILSETDIGIDVLALQLKDATEQKKAWEQAEALLKLAIGKKLDDANVKAVETPYGVACWRVQNRRSAKADRFRELCEEYRVDCEWERRVLATTATTLDPKKLDGHLAAFINPMSPEDEALRNAIEEAIEEKTVSFVLLTPLRKAAPKLERETVDREAF